MHTTERRARSTTRGTKVSVPEVTQPPARPSSPTVARARAILTDLFGPVAQRGFAVRLWDDSTDTPSDPDGPRFTLVLRHPGALRRMLLPPTNRALGEAYVRDDFDIEGDIEAATGLGDPLAARFRSPATTARLVGRLLRLPARAPAAQPTTGFRAGGTRHTRRRDAEAVRFHYDLGNEFFALWLDRRMVYSCAYFENGTESLDAAQEAKLDLICRKLRLAPGERFLDIGCGWGALIAHAAAHYGVEATGITLSEPQAALARAHIAAAGLSERCRVEVRDYRDVSAEMIFDKIASVGMVEHVGQARLPDYYSAVHRLLAPGGLFLNHGIVSLTHGESGSRLATAARRWGSFIERYVFPDGELLPPASLIAPAEAACLETRDVESLREHYALTLRHWVRRLEEHRATAVALVGEQAYRVWRLYMAGSAHAFASGRIGIVQVLLGKRDPNGQLRLPLARRDLYLNHELPAHWRSAAITMSREVSDDGPR